jgi:hypothetical protein
VNTYWVYWVLTHVSFPPNLFIYDVLAPPQVQEVDILTQRCNRLREDKEFLLECARVDREEAQDKLDALKKNYNENVLSCTRFETERFETELNNALKANESLRRTLEQTHLEKEQWRHNYAIEFDRVRSKDVKSSMDTIQRLELKIKMLGKL